MKNNKWLLFLTISLALPTSLVAEETDEPKSLEAKAAKKQAIDEADTKLDQFGFGPALYVIKYEEEVLSDSKDVRTKGDGTIDANGTSYSVSIGLELHYDFSFWHNVKCSTDECKSKDDWKFSSAHRISPFLGLYDLDNGINGIAAGIVYGHIRGDGNFENKTTLNAGI